jgi:hypothetical protein
LICRGVSTLVLGFFYTAQCKTLLKSRLRGYATQALDIYELIEYHCLIY